MIPVSGLMAIYCSLYIRRITGIGDGWLKAREAGRSPRTILTETSSPWSYPRNRRLPMRS